MAYFAGLDVSVKETRVCIVDDAGKIVREARVASEPEALLQELTIYRFKRVGLEAGPLSQWLYSVLAEAGFPVICVETRRMRAVLNPLTGRSVFCSAFVRQCRVLPTARFSRHAATHESPRREDQIWVCRLVAQSRDHPRG